MEMKLIHTRPHYLGVKGWAWAIRYKLERYLYILHRLTGLWLFLFVLVHLITIVDLRIQGRNVFAGIVIMFQNPWWRAFAVLAIAALSYHALNGVRLILQQLGFTLGRPMPAIFPYTDALRRKRPVTVGIMTAAAVFIFALLLDFLVGGW